MDEEAQKRNTDCVYFLASPLTCKKGNDCEYRHSESARINPRDCWFWLGGNCLNANCPFRHPPLEGRPTAPAAPPAVATKARVPCFFFSQGFCAKGEKCSFMHGPPAATNTEVAVSQKPPKQLAGKATDSNEKQSTANKGNGSTTPKPVTESSQEVQTASESRPAIQKESHIAHAKASRPTQDSLPTQNDAAGARVPPEGSVSSGPARPHGWQASLGENRLRQVPSAEDRLRQVQPSDDRLIQLQSGEDRIRQIQSGEERIQNGMEAEEWWEESSPGFDVLVDDGPDQLVYPEDAEYLSHHDVTMDPGRSRSRGMMMHTDDVAEFEYEHPSAYDQSGYYDASGQYDHGSYDPYDQQLGYEHVISYDHVGRKQTVAYNDRSAAYNDSRVDEAIVRDRRGMVLEGEMRHSSGDLRNRITKRRRVDRAQQSSGDAHHRRHHQDSEAKDYQHSRIHQDQHSKQQEVLMRHQISGQQGVRPSHRRLHGRVEAAGNKRVYHDIGSDYDGASPERVTLKSSPNKRNLIEHARAKFKERERGGLAFEATAAPEAGSLISSNTKKTELKKEPSSFDGPKSLAQIKAEKRKATGEENSSSRDMPDGFKSAMQSCSHQSCGIQRQAVSVRSQISPAPGSAFDVVYKEAVEEKKISLGKVVVHESTKIPDFEGPKSLSAILKAKRKPEPEVELRSEDIRKEQMSKRISLRPDLASILPTSVAIPNANSLVPESEKEVEDGELLQDTNLTQASCLPVFNGTDKKYSETSKAVLVNHRENEMLLTETNAHGSGLTSNEMAETIDGVQSREGENVGEGIDPTDDIEDGTETGDNALDDEEFGLDDDDEDDFAKKLGGFFS